MGIWQIDKHSKNQFAFVIRNKLKVETTKKGRKQKGESFQRRLPKEREEAAAITMRDSVHVTERERERDSDAENMTIEECVCVRF